MLSGIPEMPDCVCDMESVESVCDMGPLSLAFLVNAISLRRIHLSPLFWGYLQVLIFI